MTNQCSYHLPKFFHIFIPLGSIRNTLWISLFAHTLLKIVEQFSSEGIIYTNKMVSRFEKIAESLYVITGYSMKPREVECCTRAHRRKDVWPQGLSAVWRWREWAHDICISYSGVSRLAILARGGSQYSNTRNPHNSHCATVVKLI